MTNHDGSIAPHAFVALTPEGDDGTIVGYAGPPPRGLRGRLASMREGMAHVASTAYGPPFSATGATRPVDVASSRLVGARLPSVPEGSPRRDAAPPFDVASPRMNRVCRRAIDARLHRMELGGSAGGSAPAIRRYA